MIESSHLAQRIETRSLESPDAEWAKLSPNDLLNLWSKSVTFFVRGCERSPSHFYVENDIPPCNGRRKDTTQLLRVYPGNSYLVFVGFTFLRCDS